MLAPTECVISTGRAVQLMWSESKDGSIQISIRRSMDSAGGIKRVGTTENSSWTHSEQNQSESNTITFQDSGVLKSAKAIRDKIGRKSTKYVRDNKERWLKDPGAFFGVSGFGSVEQFSYHSLVNPKNELYQYQNPFHKINLARCFEERLESARRCDTNFLEIHCMTSLIECLQSDYGMLNSNRRANIRNTIKRYIKEGNALRSLSKDHPGVLLRVIPYLAGNDLKNAHVLLQSNLSISELLGEKILKESKALDELSLALLHGLRSAKRKNHGSDQTPAKRLKPWGADTVIQHSLPTGVLGEIDTAMIYRFPELGSCQVQHGDNVQTAEEMADGNGSSFVGSQPAQHATELARRVGGGHTATAMVSGALSVTGASLTAISRQDVGQTYGPVENILKAPFLSTASSGQEFLGQGTTVNTRSIRPNCKKNIPEEVLPRKRCFTVREEQVAQSCQSLLRYQPQTQRTIPDSAPSIQYAIKGNIHGLRNLFSNGLASPRDVSYSRGFSLMRWALYGGMCNHETIRFLLDSGALVDEESYQHVWDYAYRAKCSVEELLQLKCITLNPPSVDRDWPEEQNFPAIHQIIFGRLLKPLSDELRDNPDAVQLKDAMGRTALDWATALAKIPYMELLIAWNSPLNNVDKDGRSTILHAVDSHNDSVLRMLLEAGANPNPEVPEGLFRSSPLIAASFGAMVGMVELLISHGAKIDERNPEGRSPLTTAIKYNNHAVLKLLIDRYITCPNEDHLVSIIAEFADVETMSILKSSDLLGTLLDEGIIAAHHGTIQSRTDYSEELGIAFQSLGRRRI